ncbi:hypothetical protein AAKU58_000184 [Oxalobacteraceae bacterium GrIS 1.18]
MIRIRSALAGTNSTPKPARVVRFETDKTEMKPVVSSSFARPQTKRTGDPSQSIKGVSIVIDQAKKNEEICAGFRKAVGLDSAPQPKPRKSWFDL